MFFFSRKKSLVKRAARRAALMGVVLVLLAGLLFVSCSESNTDPPTQPPQDISFLHGTWYSTNSGIDFFIIDADAKTLEYASGYGAAGAYAGNILDVATDTSGTGTSGVIYIKFTTKPEVYGTGELVEGDYTGIYFKEVQTTTSQGFYLPTDDSYTPVTTNTLAKAKTTLSIDDFDTYVTFDIEYAKVDGGNGGVHPNPLEGAWGDEYDTIFTITKTTVVSAMDYGGYAMPLFAGDIFKVVNKSATEGYIVFRYVGVYNDELLGTYSVLYWKSLAANSVKMAVAGDDYGGGTEAGEATVAAAVSKYSSGNATDFDFTDFDKQ